ncbi:hypothetical protein [Flagellimonas sp.]|uniref:hypothetical protein n=1 Tax=Flagellimonas sp. TaxID=2058762 RepID=UPI003B50CB85
MQSAKTDFHKHIAHLFYAITMADKKIVADEKRKIVAYVEKYWSTTIDGENSTEIIYETLRGLIKIKLGSDRAFEVFKLYFENNIEEFPEEVRKRLMETVDGIALSVSKRNKSELILLTKIHRLLFKN